MTKPPIHSLIDASAKCVKCGAPMGKCSCWITLECPGCHQKRTVERDETDPANCARIVTSCPECNHGDFALVDYYDAEGRQINCDGDPITPPNEPVQEPHDACTHLP